MSYCIRVFLCLLCLAGPTVAWTDEVHTKTVVPFLKSHCLRCHGPETQESDLRLDTLSADFTASGTARHWIEVMDRINLGEMPPEGEPRPKLKEQQAVVSWIANGLREAERASLSSGGRVLLRRMNRQEYANTVRDLLKVKFLPGEGPLDLLPADGEAEGFDKVSKALMLDPSLMEKYFHVGRAIANKAIIEGPPEFPTKLVRYEYEDTATNTAIRYQCHRPDFRCREHDIMVMNSAARTFGRLMYGDTKRMIPTKGRYAVRVRAWGDPGESEAPVEMRVNRGTEWSVTTEVSEEPKVYEFIVPFDQRGGNELQAGIVKGSGFYQYNRAAGDLDKANREAGQNGEFRKALLMDARASTEGLTERSRPDPDKVDITPLPKLYLDWIEVEGPLYESWPPQSHQLIFFKGSEAKQDLKYAREIFSRLLPQAYRRPVSPAEVEPIVKLVEQELNHGMTYEEAIRTGITAVLTSPKFLYLFEPSDADEPRRLNSFEVASRLSYFLWSSMPDERLFELAKSQRLREPSVLQAEVNRMLADAKSEAFVQGFAAQWLRTDEFRTFRPDERLYPDYDDELGEAMVQETLSFFKEILHQDLSALNFIDSDFTMLNEKLAKFYGIPGVQGDEFRPVALPEGSHRGGLLTQAGVLMYGSDGNRTKPVHRGVYVREVLFNDPPNPPPPNVGEIEPNIKGKNLTVRERLLQHQQIASCAACHRTIDPYGLALENYDVIGMWREQQNGEDFRGNNRPPIIASGTLPNGKSFETPDEFKALLMEQRDRFARALTEKLLIYALGRPLEPRDRTLVDRLATQMANNGYSLRSLLHGIVTSEAFLEK